MDIKVLRIFLNFAIGKIFVMLADIFKIFERMKTDVLWLIKLNLIFINFQKFETIIGIIYESVILADW